MSGDVDLDLDLPALQVAVTIPEPDGFDDQAISVEMSLDNELLVVVEWPNDGKPVDRDLLHQTLTMAFGSIDQILDQMEAS